MLHGNFGSDLLRGPATFFAPLSLSVSTGISRMNGLRACVLRHSRRSQAVDIPTGIVQHVPAARAHVSSRDKTLKLIRMIF